MNQISWLTLTIHLNGFQKVKDELEEYPEIRRRIKRFEIKTRILFFAFVFINIMICICLIIFQIIYNWQPIRYFEKSENGSSYEFYFILRNAYYVTLLLIILSLWFTQIYVYKILVKAMKNNISVIYKKKKKDIRLILIISLICTSFV